jgi:cytoskeletal protein RodZ
VATNLDSEDDTMARGQIGVEAPTRELPTAPLTASGDRCTNCGAPLGHDQRYCVECGERRGQSTLPPTEPAVEVRSRRARAEGAKRPPRVSSGATLVSGVGVLLLAIGLGVLIGHLGTNTTTTRGSAQSPITIYQNGAAASTSATTTTSTTAQPTRKSHAKSKSAAAATPPPAVQKKATQAAGKVLGNSNNLAPPTVTTGQKCSSSQAGCSNGSFNGNFFGQ